MRGRREMDENAGSSYRYTRAAHGRGLPSSAAFCQCRSSAAGLRERMAINFPHSKKTVVGLKQVTLLAGAVALSAQKVGAYWEVSAASDIILRPVETLGPHSKCGHSELLSVPFKQSLTRQAIGCVG